MSFSDSRLKHIGLPILGSSFFHMEAKEKLNFECLKIDSDLLQNIAKLINPAWISIPERKFSE